jgi:hypothetical protein
MGERHRKDKIRSRFEGFFKIRKKTAKAGKVIKSKKDKEKEKRVKHRELIRESEET